MLRFLKWVKVGFWALVSTALVALLVGIGIIDQNRPPSWEKIMHGDKISAEYPADYRRAIEKSRLSAVRVRSTSLSFWGSTATMTGTYFIASNKHYVITVHHGIIGPCWLVVVDHRSTSSQCKEYVVKDEVLDYVIMELDEPLPNRTPIKIPQDLPAGTKNWENSYSLLTNIIYTGYPNTLGPLTLKGDVAGYAPEYLYVFSHAYGGASGSGIFTKDGHYIGYLVAVDLGSTELGIDVLENIVIVAPSFNVDWSAVTN
tara:strand:+ start:940 stop:1713 length:774 start_codon:yes stop_codon:yes gene_type:complete